MPTRHASLDARLVALETRQEQHIGRIWDQYFDAVRALLGAADYDRYCDALDLHQPYADIWARIKADPRCARLLLAAGHHERYRQYAIGIGARPKPAK